MDQPITGAPPAIDRRRHPRLCAGVQASGGLCARLRSGQELTLVDASASGVLVEGACRPLPGANVEVQFVTTRGRYVITGRVVRCSVVALHPDLGVRYRAAVAVEGGTDLRALLEVLGG